MWLEMHQSILKIIDGVLKHSRSNSMYTGIGFVCKCISHHVAKMADQGIHQNYINSSTLFKLVESLWILIITRFVGLEIKKNLKQPTYTSFNFPMLASTMQCHNTTYVYIQCELTTVMSDAEKHHTLLMLTSRHSHNPPPSSHSMANIRSAIDRTKIGCTCAYM